MWFGSIIYERPRQQARRRQGCPSIGSVVVSLTSARWYCYCNFINQLSDYLFPIHLPSLFDGKNLAADELIASRLECIQLNVCMWSARTHQESS